MMNDQQVDTLRVVSALYRHLAEEHCHHTYSSIVKEALKSKSAGLAAQPQQTTDADVITSRSNLHDYADK
jgi:hypothetical protein